MPLSNGANAPIQFVAALALASAPILVSPDTGVAQQAQPLPHIEVVSPVAKPKKTPKPAAQKKAPVKAKAATAAAEPAPATPPPVETPPSDAGPLVITEDAFASVTVATEREITAKQGNTITDTLATKPGISGSTFAPGASRPIIRGLDENRVRIQENGISSQDASAISEDHAFPIDPYAADRVEVVRGPATLRYGSQAIGGVVAVENNRIPSAIPRSGYDAVMRGGWSSVDEGRDGSFSTNAGAGNFVFHADGFTRRAEDYDTPNGHQSNSFVDTDGMSFGGSLVSKDGYAGVSFTEFNSLYGIPGEDARIDMQQDKIMSKGEWRPKANGIEAIRYWFGASEYQHNEVEPDGAVAARFLNDEQEGRVELQHQPFATGLGEVRGAVGVQISHRKTSGISIEGDDLLAPSTTDQVAGFIFEELQVSRLLRLQAAGRIEQNDVDGIGIEDPFSAAPVLVGRDLSFTPMSGSIGALYELPHDIVARLTGSYVERAPAATELFSKGAHEASGTFEIGNPDLNIESAQTVELGFKRAQGSLRFDTSLYYTRFTDFIYRQFTPDVFCDETLDSCGPDGELQQVTFQQRGATFYGFELAAQYDVARVWNGLWGLDGEYDFVHAEFSDGENVPRIPPHRAGGGIYYRDQAWFFRTGVLHAFDQDRIGVGETPTDGYTLLSAELSYTDATRLAGQTTEYTIGIKGENLADDDVRNHSSFLKDEVLQPGASVRMFGIVKLN